MTVPAASSTTRRTWPSQVERAVDAGLEQRRVPSLVGLLGCLIGPVGIGQRFPLSQRRHEVVVAEHRGVMGEDRIGLRDVLSDARIGDRASDGPNVLGRDAAPGVGRLDEWEAAEGPAGLHPPVRFGPGQPTDRLEGSLGRLVPIQAERRAAVQVARRPVGAVVQTPAQHFQPVDEGELLGRGERVE